MLAPIFFASAVSALATAEYFFNGGNVTCASRTFSGGDITAFKQVSASEATSLGFTLPAPVEHPGNYEQKLFVNEEAGIEYGVPGYVDKINWVQSNFDFQYELAEYRKGSSSPWIACAQTQK